MLNNYKNVIIKISCSDGIVADYDKSPHTSTFLDFFFFLPR